MFKRILVPLDGSALAESAIPVAARLARAVGGTVILMQVVAVPAETGKVPIVIYSQQAIDKSLSPALEYLERIAQSSTLYRNAVEIQTMSGATAPSIISAIDSLQADLIVMSSHGNTPIKRWTLGSVTQKIARHSSVPVLVLHEGKHTLSFAQQHDAEYPVAALVPLDGSSSSELVLEPTVEILAALATPGKAYRHQ